jgi:hypothetical protein
MARSTPATSFWTRRKFIFVGVVGAVAAGVVAVAPKLAGDGKAVKGGILIAEHSNILRVVAMALLGSALSPDAPARAAEIARTNTAIAALIDNFPAHTRKEVSDLFTLLSLKPARALLGYSGDWQDADVPKVAQFLYDLRDSSIGMKQQAYFALHDLVLGSFYSEPQTWKATGYPGPPRLA